MKRQKLELSLTELRQLLTSSLARLFNLNSAFEESSSCSGTPSRAKAGAFAYVVVVLKNPDRFAIRLTEQNSSIGLFAVTESRCTEDEHEDDSKFRNLGLRACL